MDELFIVDNYASLTRTDRENCSRKGVRLYRASPFSANIQIRTHTDKLGYFASASLTADECRALAAKLLEAADSLRDEYPRYTEPAKHGL